MISTKWLRAFGIGIPTISALALLGITQNLFDIGIDTNLYNTGLTLALILGIGQIFIIVAVSRNWI